VEAIAFGIIAFAIGASIWIFAEEIGDLARAYAWGAKT
jgi:hypothetical protein